MAIKLSYSAVQKYLFCPALYSHHYIDRIRPINVGSPLPFGSALDDAFGRLKFEKKDTLTSKEKKLINKSAEEVFIDSFNSFNYNNRNLLLATDNRIVYNKADIDLSLLNEQDHKILSDFDPEVEDYNKFIEESFAILKSKKDLEDKDRKLYNYIAYLSLYRKGLMLIDAYRKDILPKIHKVYDLQKKIELPDNNGNVIIGYIDAIVSFVDNPEIKVVLDDKTSSKPYAMDSVLKSHQLATYAEAELLDYGAYAVAEKLIRKRKPRARTQLIIDKIPEETYDKTFKEYSKVLKGIQNKKFNKNYDSGCFQFGQVCPYYSYCRTNGKNKKGLEEV